MQKLSCQLILFFFIFCFYDVKPAKGNHSTSLGGDLTYTSISQDSVMVQYKYYRNCAAATQSNATLQLQYLAPGCHTGGTITLTRNSLIQGISNGCPTGTCNNGKPGVFYEESIYAGILVLPANCSNWAFSVIRPDRVATNLDSAATVNMYSEAVLNNSGNIINTSSAFSYLPPILYACVNQPATFYLGVVNLDSDSLVYSLTNLLMAANIPHPFNPGYSATSPLGGTVPLNFNSQTGLLTFTPTGAIYSNYAFRLTIKEYRRINGVPVVVGETNRDMMVITEPCPPKPPVTFTTPGQSVDSVFIFRAGVPTCFSITINNPDTTSIMRASSNLLQIIPSATYTVSSDASPVFRFCFRPSTADINRLMAFNITARDNACPIPSFTIQRIRILVVKNRISDPGPVVIADPNQPGVSRITIPNIITPNGDGINDAFVIPDLPENAELQILDRKHRAIRTFKNYRNNWNAEGLKDGVYFYILKDKATGEVTKGQVTVVR